MRTSPHQAVFASDCRIRTRRVAVRIPVRRASGRGGSRPPGRLAPRAVHSAFGALAAVTFGPRRARAGTPPARTPGVATPGRRLDRSSHLRGHSRRTRARLHSAPGTRRSRTRAATREPRSPPPGTRGAATPRRRVRAFRTACLVRSMDATPGPSGAHTGTPHSVHTLVPRPMVAVFAPSAHSRSHSRASLQVVALPCRRAAAHPMHGTPCTCCRAPSFH